jgi:hypothetical protein
MMRLQSWPEALAAYFESRRYLPFAWRLNDCTSFAAGAVEAMTGVMPELPRYKSAAQAARLIGQRSLRGRVGDVYGAEIPCASAFRGDLVLMLLDGRETLGVSDGHLIAGPGAEGMLLVPRSAGVCGWRV